MYYYYIECEESLVDLFW